MVHYNIIMEGVWTGRQLEHTFKIMICCCGNSFMQSLWCRLAADISAAVLLGIHLNTYDKDIMFVVLPLYVHNHSEF